MGFLNFLKPFCVERNRSLTQEGFFLTNFANQTDLWQLFNISETKLAEVSFAPVFSCLFTRYLAVSSQSQLSIFFLLYEIRFSLSYIVFSLLQSSQMKTLFFFTKKERHFFCHKYRYVLKYE